MCIATTSEAKPLIQKQSSLDPDPFTDQGLLSRNLSATISLFVRWTCPRAARMQMRGT